VVDVVTRRRQQLIGMIAIAVILAGGLLMLVLPSAHPLPEVVSAASRCKKSGTTAVPETSGPGALVPDVSYDIVQLCPAGPAPGERTPIHFINDDTSADLVRRLNALPASPRSAGCSDPPGNAVDVILKQGGNRVVLQLDLSTCGTVRRDGMVRSGATEIHRYLTRLTDGG
jgi:hypothetical protein